MTALEVQVSEAALDRPLERLGLRVSTPPSTPPNIFSTTGRTSLRNLSSQALRANRKAEETWQHYTKQDAKSGADFATHAFGTRGVTDRTQSCLSRSVPPATLHGTSKDWVQSFNDDALAVDTLLQTLASDFRSRHPAPNVDGMVGDKREAELSKLLEEQRRARATEERIARQKLRDARDPHRKVSIMIENTRKYNMAAVHEMGIPMTQVQFNGVAGVETVDMVDFTKIRHRCKQMDTGSTPTVRALVEEQARLDRWSCGSSKVGKAKALSMSDLHSQKPSGNTCKSSSVGFAKSNRGLRVGQGRMPSMTRRAAWQEPD